MTLRQALVWFSLGIVGCADGESLITGEATQALTATDMQPLDDVRDTGVFYGFADPPDPDLDPPDPDLDPPDPDLDPPDPDLDPPDPDMPTLLMMFQPVKNLARVSAYSDSRGIAAVVTADPPTEHAADPPSEYTGDPPTEHVRLRVRLVRSATLDIYDVDGKLLTSVSAN